MPHDTAAIGADADDVARDVLFQLLFALGDLAVELFAHLVDRGSDLGFGLGLDLVVHQPSFDDAGDGVRAGKDTTAFFPRWGRAADGAELFDDDLDVNAGTQRQRHQPTDGFQLGGRASACLTHRHKDFERTAVLVRIDRDIQVAAAGRDLGRRAHDDLGPGPGAYFAFGDLLFFLRRVFCADAQDLLGTAVIAIDGQALAAHLVGEHVGMAHIVDRRVFVEVDGLGNGVVRVFLEDRLHLDVPFGDDVVGRHERAADLRRDVGDLLDRALFGYLFHELARIQAPLLHHFPESGLDLHHLVVVQDVGALITEREHRLDAGRARPGDDRYRACGRDGGERRVAQAQVARLKNTALVCRESASGAGQVQGLLAGLGLDERHNFFSQGDRLVGIIRDHHLGQGARPAHDAQADLAGLLGHLVDLGKRILVDVDDVVQEVDGKMDDLF